MFKIRMAGLLFQINNRYDLIEEKCLEYKVETSDKADFILEVSDEEIHFVQNWKRENDGVEISAAEAEYDKAPYAIYPKLFPYKASWLHAAVVEMDGEAFAFTAPSGYGKSTHIKLWLKAFGEKVKIINGDNPILRCIDGTFYAFGTPFCGKEGFHVNTAAPLKGICYLRRSEKNSIERLDPSLAFAQLVRDNWTLVEAETEAASYLPFYAELVEKVPVYLLKCNQEVQAAQIAREGMR